MNVAMLCRHVLREIRVGTVVLVMPNPGFQHFHDQTVFRLQMAKRPPVPTLEVKWSSVAGASFWEVVSARDLVFFGVKWLRPAMKGTSRV